ncbi:MAG TPA: hypothetical protein VJO34_09150 [Methylomirabilota bacterium]|nr:hypothetical protein [Methylomirabilota bacterium]
MADDKRWIDWNKPVTIFSILVAMAIAVGVYLWVAAWVGAKPVFEFDDGTVQGWTASGILDDSGNKYNGSLVNVFHAEQHQYPDKFPCAQDPSKCDPLKDKNGGLGISVAELQPTLPKFNFPSNSAYWQVYVVSPTLLKQFQNKTEFEASIGDMFGVDPGHIKATLLLNIEVGGSVTEISPVGGIVEQVVSKTSWTKLSAKFAVPSGASVRNIVVRVRGDWKTYKIYEGAIFVDHVAATN